MAYNSKSSRVSAFDEALSRPLVPSSKNYVEANSSSQVEQKQFISSSRPKATSFSSIKLPTQNSRRISTPANPFDDSYQPPNLLQEQDQQKVSLLAGMEEGTHMDEVLLRERHTETLEITREMRQIHEISQDLANIVNDQQSNFDEIEEDAHAVHDSAERGVGHLERAARLINSTSQIESFWKVLFGVLAMGGLVIAIILFTQGI